MHSVFRYVSEQRMRTESKESFYRFLIFLIVLLLPSMVWSLESSLISFEVKDQFDRVYTDGQFRGSILVSIGSDKDGSKYNEIWTQAIYDSLKGEENFDRIRFLGVADVRGVPFFLKGYVRGKFPKEKEKWVLLDWKGVFAKAYEFEPEMSNVAIFSPGGALVHRTSGQTIDKHKLATVLAKLRSLMRK